MNTFKIWIENLETEKSKKIRDIWHDAFQALGIGGLSDEDASYQSLSKINYGRRNPVNNDVSTFKGKKAALKRLENGQIFNRLLELQDPQLSGAVEQAKQWLGQDETKQNADTTVGTLMKILFGKYYQKLIDSKSTVTEPAKLTKAPAQVPQQNVMQNPGNAPQNAPQMQNPLQMQPQNAIV